VSNWALLLLLQVDDGPCVMYIGDGGAGNYVKMVHNGIEYGDMQLISGAGWKAHVLVTRCVGLVTISYSVMCIENKHSQAVVQ
jgi:6-phosphogluconate dehydrogenase